MLFIGIVLALFVQMMPTGVLAGHNGSSNNPPTIDPVVNQTVAEGDLLHVEITASDADGDPLIWEAVSLPAGSNFQQNSSYQAYFWWIPGYDQSGIHEVKYRARDSDAGTSGSFFVNVTESNRSPQLDAVRNAWTYELTKIQFDIKASDADGDELTWQFQSIPTPDHNTTALPAGVFLDNVGHYDAGFNWTPDCTQGLPGTPSTGGGARYQFQANVSDGEFTVSQQWNVTVYNTDAPADLNTITHKLALEGTILSFNITATACDDEDHFLEVGTVSAFPSSIDPAPLPVDLPWSTELPLNAAVTPEDVSGNKSVPMLFNNVTDEYYSVFSWDIGNNQAGNYTFYANITDAGNNTDHIQWTIRVTENNTAPVFDLLPACAASGLCYGKEDTLFNLTAPLGSTTGFGCHWDGTAVVAGAPPTPEFIPVFCGTPFIANVHDVDNDRIFWNLEWLTKNGKTVSAGLLPQGMTMIAQGTNFTTGFPSNATVPAVAANISAAHIIWLPDYAAAGTYGFRLWATDGINETSAYFDIQVENTNRRPVIDAVRNITVFEGEPIRFEVSGTDEDMKDANPDLVDRISLFMGNVSAGPAALPAGADFHDGHDQDFTTFRGAFTWTPGYHQAGVYELQVFASDADTRYLYPGHPLGYGNHTQVAGGDIHHPTVAPTPWVNPGFGAKVAPETWTEFSNVGALFNITVINVDRAPLLTGIDDVSVAGGASVYVPFAAYDPDFDPITFNVSGNPSFLSLTDNGDGTGYLSGTATQGGVWDITVEACSSPLICDTETFRLVVVVDTAYDLKPTQAFFKAAPGVPLTVPIQITNTGPANSEIVNLELVFADGTTGTIQATAPVAGGETVWANATITVAPDVSQTFVKVKGTSSIDPSYVRTATVRVDVPVFASTTMISTTPGTIQGQVNVTFLDGSPVVIQPITVTQSPSVNPLGLISSNAKGYTAGDGSFVFKFTAADRSANLPGEHKLTAEITYGGSTYVVDAGSYTV